MMFKCERLSCTMEQAACVIRRLNAITGWVAGSSSAPNKPGALDTGCRECDQGKQIEKEVSPGAVKAYQMRVGGARKWGKKEMAKPGILPENSSDTSVPAKICADPNCDHKGSPQPLDHFHNNKATADGKSNYCKPCMRRRQKEYDQKRRGAVKPKIKEIEVTEKTEKRCNTCITVKPIEDFAPSNTSKDGRMHICRSCFRGRQESGLRRENKVTILHLNFEGHADLLAELSRVAAVEFRTVQAQAMFIIERALARN